MFHVKHASSSDNGATSGRENADRGRPDLFHEPVRRCTFEIEEKRSRFIARIERCSDERSAREQILRVREQNASANHVVYAYRCGTPRPTREGCSDDGEPHGTAGRPLLDALSYARLTNSLLSVVRYFGGTKLGTGGLVRAYGGVARSVIEKALAEAATRACIREVERTISLSYANHQIVRHVCEREGAVVRDEHFAQLVELTISVEQPDFAQLADAIREATAGAVDIGDTGEAADPTRF